MIYYFLLAFVLTEIFVAISIEIIKYKSYEFPTFKITKNGIKFFSLKQHKINISNLKVFNFGENFYLRTNSQIIIFSNVKNVKVKNKNMYFVCCGNVNIEFNFTMFYKYFNIKVNIEDFNFNLLKQNAILDFLNNQFDVEKSKKFQAFLKFIKNTLKIHINKKNLSIFSNNLKISYQLIYKLNNKIKKINVQNTIGKI